MIYATSDLHGYLPEPPSDATGLLIAGDVALHGNATAQSVWMEGDFKHWAEAIGVPILATWGNHDYVGENPGLVPEIGNVTWLVDEEALLGDLRVYGTPWVPNLPRWAFYASPRALEARAEMIPRGLDVLMSHGPPFGVADFVPTNTVQQQKYFNFHGKHVGDPSLNDAIRRAEPKLTICGHIHEDRGSHKLDNEYRILNVAAVDGLYDLHSDPWQAIQP